MARPFNFPSQTKFEARLRQKGQCACCGDPLDDVMEHAHHVIPNQSGSAKNPKHAWLRSVDNCVVLCEECHWRVHHNGRYQKGAVAPPEYYEHSHGRKNTAAHRAWVVKLHGLTRLIWPN